MHIKFRSLFGIALLLLVTACGGGGGGSDTPVATQENWVTSFSAAPEEGSLNDIMIPPFNWFDNQTVRMIVRTTIGGNRLRIRLSNVNGPGEVVVAAAHVAKLAPAVATGTAILPDTDRVLTFAGSGTVTLAANKVVRLSDPVGLAVEAGTDLAVTLYVSNNIGPSTWHLQGRMDGTKSSFVSTLAGVNRTGEVDMAADSTGTASWHWLAGVDVDTQAINTRSIVAFGDSITDGTAATGPFTDWPSRLFERPQAGGKNLAVANAAIAGNRVIPNDMGSWGDGATMRFHRDALDLPGTKYVIFLEGINDVWQTAPAPALGIPAIP
jgi:hypothetical protein